MQTLAVAVRSVALLQKVFTGRSGGPALLAGILLLHGVSISIAQNAAELPARLIGATAIITEVSTGLPFAARVDTGATSCSIHCEAIEIDDADEDPKGNIGKQIRFLVKNKDGGKEWVESKIVDYVTVRTAKVDDDRYKVRLKLRWEDVEKKVLVTLNDREKMRYPLLLGRNFLKDDFLVHVSLHVDE